MKDFLEYFTNDECLLPSLVGDIDPHDKLSIEPLVMSWMEISFREWKSQGMFPHIPEFDYQEVLLSQEWEAIVSYLESAADQMVL